MPTEEQLESAETGRVARIVDAACMLAREAEGLVCCRWNDGDGGGEEEEEEEKDKEEEEAQKARARFLFVDLVEAYLEAYFRRAEIGRADVVWRNWAVLARQAERRGWWC